MAEYTIQPGDTLTALAEKWDTTIAAILEANPYITDPDKIYIGNTLVIPGEDGTTPAEEEPVPAVPTEAPAALPQGAILVKVGNAYRVVWEIPDIGWSWYTISPETLEQLYGDEVVPAETFGTVEAFVAKYGDMYWGDVTEISATGEDPWTNMLDSIFSEFGFIAGLDDPEVRALIIQGYFESWTYSQFQSYYQNTAFYNSLSEQAQIWNSVSEAEQEAMVRSMAAKMTEEYFAYWGTYPEGGINNAAIQADARRVASGEITFNEWVYNTRTSAEKVPETPAFRSVREEEEEQREREMTIEDTVRQLRELWHYWIGPSDAAESWLNSWANNIVTNINSWDDVTEHLKSRSNSRWGTKPEDIPYAEWAAPIEDQIMDILELTSLDPNDNLLSDALNSGYQGSDLTKMIRADERFKNTNRAYREMSTAVNSLGRMFGFVA